MRQRTETTKNTIVTAAHALFLEHGFAATGMDDIAGAAGVAKQTLYGYFPDKRALFTAVVEHAVGTPWQLQAAAPLQMTREHLTTSLYTILSGINNVGMQPQYIKLLRTIVTEAPQQPELGDIFRKGVTYRSLQALTALFTTANAQGVAAIPDPTLAAQFFLGGMVVRIFLDGLLAADPRAIRALSEAELREYVAAFVRCITPHKSKKER